MKTKVYLVISKFTTDIILEVFLHGMSPGFIHSSFKREMDPENVSVFSRGKEWGRMHTARKLSYTTWLWNSRAVFSLSVSLLP